MRLFDTCFILALAVPLFAQEPAVRQLKTFLREGNLAVQVELADLFSPKITSTIRSGLPAIVRCDFRVVNETNKEILRALHPLQVVFDIWSQRYHVTLADTMRYASSFEETENLISRFEILHLATLSRLDSTKIYRVRLRVEVIPISAEQSRRFLQRLESSDLTGSEAASESGRSGFSLNLSRLLSFFLSGEERTHGSTDWFTSAPFRSAEKP